MTETAQLEDLFDITDGSYTTGSEYVDGLLIGLATLLLIRNGEFVVLDILTFLFGDRRQRIGFRVMRTWQMLSAKHFYHLITGFDSDIPHSCLRRAHCEKRSSTFPGPCWKVKKGRFVSKLFLCVLLGKILVLGTELAIIAFVIPVDKVHRSEGGLGFKWKNTTITEDDFQTKEHRNTSSSSFPTKSDECMPLLTSKSLVDAAQVMICRRLDICDLNSSQLSKARHWIKNGSLRVEEIYLTRDTLKRAGGIVTKGKVFCSDQPFNNESSSIRLHSHTTSRQASNPPAPCKLSSNLSRVEFRKSELVGEIEIYGYTVQTPFVETFGYGSAAMLPIFIEAHPQRLLRLTFGESILRRGLNVEGRGLTVNGKLLLGSAREISGTRTSMLQAVVCPQAIEEIIRVTHTLHPELLIDLFRLSMTVDTTTEFLVPSTQRSYKHGFRIGTSRTFRIRPEWMITVAAFIVTLSWITSRLNETDVRMARVYRGHNNMFCACSPAFLDEENAVDGRLFRRENEYHWGESAGDEWAKVSTSSEISRDAVLV